MLIITNGVLSYFVSKSILTPVSSLRKGAEEIRQGNLDYQIEKFRNDELGELCEAFEAMRQQLKQSTEVQLQYEENRKELIANITHDLKTPITSIKGYVEGIRDGVASSPEKMDRYTQTIFTKADEMDRLIDELFLYSKLDLKRVPFQFETIDLRSFFQDYLEDLQLELPQQNTRIYFDDNPSEDYSAVADRDNLKRVVNNIIQNSLKYMDKDEKHIEIKLEHKKEFVLTAIQDNGKGMDGNTIRQLFERFYRGDPSRNKDTGGSGLGMAIAKRIIEEHGGDIWAESELGKGTTIFFTLKSSRK
ncbi:sensor histidine kinase [Halobacillus salinarum]